MGRSRNKWLLFPASPHLCRLKLYLKQSAVVWEPNCAVSCCAASTFGWTPVCCPEVNLYFGSRVRGVLCARPEEMSGGWLGTEKRNGGRKDDRCWFVIYLQSLRIKSLLISKLSQKGNDGLPSLKWHSHVLPASAVHSLESERDVEKKETHKFKKKSEVSSCQHCVTQEETELAGKVEGSTKYFKTGG